MEFQTPSAGDSAFLINTSRPDYTAGNPELRIADLFCGCGGLSLGWSEAARREGIATDIRLAVDADPTVCDVYSANFPNANVVAADLRQLLNGRSGERLTQNERSLRRTVGPIDVLLGGPPCQGHSDLNNHTRRSDPRNESYSLMARAAQVLEPDVVIIENVPRVQNDVAGVLDRTKAALEESGYRIADEVISLHKIGVPQKRRRHTLLGIRNGDMLPDEVFGALRDQPEEEGRDLSWAISDLEYLHDRTGLDVPSSTSPVNSERIAWLFETDSHDLDNSQRPTCQQREHSYRSMYGRLKWHEPAQTITTGFGSMGQGRYVHPSQRRTLTPHEAARVQFFPDWFDFTADGKVFKRRYWATMIGNAVPPKMTMELGRLLLPMLVSRL